MRDRDYLDEVLSKPFDDGLTMQEKYPESLYDFILVGPTLMLNHDPLCVTEKQWYQAKVNFDEDKMILTYSDYFNYRPEGKDVTRPVTAKCSCYLHTSDVMVSHAEIYVCRKNNTEDFIKYFSDSELIDELFRRILESKNKTE